jgi:UDP-glucose 4-epimerase
MMRVLITGGAGFIGSNLADYHIKKGDEVSIIDNLTTGKAENLTNIIKNPHLRFHHQDLLSWSGLKKELVWSERVYHLAAVIGMFNVLAHPIETLKVNIEGTQRLFELIDEAGVSPLVVIASSSEVYGDQSGQLHETNPIQVETSKKAHSSYAISKACNESQAMSYYQRRNIPTIVLRIFNTIGINQSSQYGMVVPRLIKQAIKNQPMTVFGDGTQSRSFCNIKDSVMLMDSLANNPNSVGEIINLGQDEPVSMNQLANLIKKIVKNQSEIIHIPFDEVYHEDYNCIQERKPDVSKLLTLVSNGFNWNLEESLRDLISYAKEVYK